MSYTPQTPHTSYPPPPPTYNTSTPPPPPPKTAALHSQTPAQFAAPQSQTLFTYDTPPALPPHPGRPQSHAGYQEQAQHQQCGITEQGNFTQNQYQPQNPNVQSEQSYPQPQNQLQQQPQPQDLPPLLSTLSLTDLRALLSDPSLLTALLNSPSTIPPSLVQSQESLLPHLTATISAAQSLLHLLSQVQAQRERTAQHLLNVRALEQGWKRKQSELERKLEPWGGRELYKRLGVGIGEGEAVCRGLEESFLEGQGGEAGEREVVEWVKRVREARRVVVLRRERKGRWDEGRVGGWR